MATSSGQSCLATKHPEMVANLMRSSATAMIAAALMASTPASAQDAPVAAEGSFANPAMPDRPMYRFWNNGGMMTPTSITEQVAQIRSSGAGGFEANQLSGVPSVSKVPGYDPQRHGFGTPEWTRAWTQLFKAGKAQGLRVDQIYTPGWSAGIQGLSPDAPGTAKEITFGSVFVNGGESYEGVVPEAKLPAGVTKRTLLGVVAYRCDSNCEAGSKSPPMLDASTALDRTASVKDGRIRFTAPAGAGRYVLVASWMHGTGQVIELAQTPTPSYMVDHFASSGAQAIVDYWETKVLNPELRQAFRDSGGSLFFDSFELNRHGEEVRHWTDNFLSEFRKRRGYSLVPYLAAISNSSNPMFEFSNGVGTRIREDYRQTLSELFVGNHILPLKQWAHSYGMTLRAQGYAGWGPTAVNNSDAAAAIDIPEQEANNRSKPMFSTDASDAWRQVVSANSQMGRTIVSSEMGTFGRTDGLSRVSLVMRMNEVIGLGMNKVVYHGWPDQTPGGSSRWPGYMPFGNAVGDNYGVQIPTFADDVTINDYVARLQTVLRRGELRNEIAMYWGGPDEARYGDLGLERSGYTYGFMSDALMAHPSAKIVDGRLTNLGYKAFVLDAQGSGIPMNLASARRLLSWARSGFPIFVIGELPARVSGYHPADDAALRKVVAALFAQKSVTRVADRAGVVNALKAAGIGSAASYDAKPLVTLHRQSEDSDYYYLFNAAADRTKAEVTLEGTGLPYRYDAWTGQVRPISLFTRTDNGVKIEVDLASGDSTLIALTPGNQDTPKPVCKTAAVSTNADELLSLDGGDPVLRDTAAGRYVTTLADGRQVSSEIATVGARKAPASWTLQVTSWQAGAGVNDIAKVALTPITLTPGADGKLPDWQHVPGLENKSGTSTYKASVDIGSGWTGGTRAYLDLGAFYGTAQVSVNGKRLPPIDQADVSRIDLGGYLRPGVNDLQVHIATPIYNAAYKTKSPYGLVGPVTVIPYGQVTVPMGCGGN
ncbi:Alpha-L-rhamnosidase [Sphingomonas paucimobilis]|nr:Alpha-L-rhamnosidase [Sphingomonas paucimobilis]